MHLLQQTPRWLFRSLRLRQQLWQLWSLWQFSESDFPEDDWKNGIQRQPIFSCAPKSIDQEARPTLQMWSAHGRYSITFNRMLKARTHVQPWFILRRKQRVLRWLDVWSFRPPTSATRNLPSQRKHFRCLPSKIRHQATSCKHRTFQGPTKTQHHHVDWTYLCLHLGQVPREDVPRDQPTAELHRYPVQLRLICGSRSRHPEHTWLASSVYQHLRRANSFPLSRNCLHEW